MGGPQEGQTTKKLRLVPAPDGKGIFFTLTVTTRDSPQAVYSLPVSNAELAVIKSLIQFSIPRFLAFDAPWTGGGLPELAQVPPPPPAYVKFNEND